MYTVSEKGWIDGDVFHGWLVKFAQYVKKRPLLLIVDGHVSHVSTNVIKIAMDKDITLLKLPLHTTDLLQPLDVACFAPLKKNGKKCSTNGEVSRAAEYGSINLRLWTNCAPFGMNALTKRT